MTRTEKSIMYEGEVTEWPTLCPSCQSTDFVAPNSWDHKLQAMVTTRGVVRMAVFFGRMLATLHETQHGAVARCKKCRKLVLACPHCHQEFHPRGELPPNYSKRVCAGCDKDIVVIHSLGD
ncbi:hypothetical protein [Streptomyces sp. NPDC014676]|uniref:hypothetical protein n=1 Tax=Streptomyces sp. NPDC014676 TaxID=3364879 RepID=UPI0036F776BA